MICDFDRIDALAEGLLGEQDTAQVREHMKNCQSCRIYYLALTDAAGSEQPPENLHERIMQRVNATAQEKAPRRQRRAWHGIAAAAACAALVLGIGLAGGGFTRGVGTDDAADMARNYEAMDSDVSGADNGSADDFAQDTQDLPLTIYTVSDAALCEQIRDWLAAQKIAALYPNGPREAYDLTADQVQALNRAIPGAELPEQPLQLELKDAQ